MLIYTHGISLHPYHRSVGAYHKYVGEAEQCHLCVLCLCSCVTVVVHLLAVVHHI